MLSVFMSQGVRAPTDGAWHMEDTPKAILSIDDDPDLLRLFREKYVLKSEPSAVELMDHMLIELARMSVDESGMGSPEPRRRLERLESGLGPKVRIGQPEAVHAVLEIRNAQVHGGKFERWTARFRDERVPPHEYVGGECNQHGRCNSKRCEPRKKPQNPSQSTAEFRQCRKCLQEGRRKPVRAHPAERVLHQVHPQDGDQRIVWATVFALRGVRLDQHH